MRTAIVGAKVYPVTREPLQVGTILIEKGKIIGVEPGDLVPDGFQVVDAHGMMATPGLIDAHTHVGIGEEGIGWEGEDYNELTDPITPQMRVIDGINPADEGFADARRGGVTSVGIHPGSANVLGGQGAALKTAGRTVEEMTLKAPVAIKGAFGENPKRVYSQQKKSPSTRMATAALLRQTLIRTNNYKRKQTKDDFESDLVYESLLPLLSGEIPFFAHAHRADDMLTALRIAKEFDLRLVLQHGTEAHLIADLLAAEGIPVVVGPSLTSRSKVELRERTFKTPGVMAKNGIKFAIMTDHPVIPLQYLAVCVRLAIHEGLGFTEALQAVTITPAEMLGVQDRVGSIEVGKDADLVLWSAEPFVETEEPARVFIDGRECWTSTNA